MPILSSSPRHLADRQSPAEALDVGTLPTPDLHLRRQRAIALARAIHGPVDALILCDPLDIHYLSGTRHGISWLVLLEGAAFAVSRHMLVSEVRAEAVSCEVLLACTRSTERPELEQFVIAEVVKRGLTHVVVDTAKLSALSYLRLTQRSRSAGIHLRDFPDCLASLRAVKDPSEIALTRRCVQIAEQAFSELVGQGASALLGRSERDLSDELEARMWALGADRQGFPETGIIVASGPNSACPHHSPGPRRVAAGESLLFDWGAEFAGYRSDITRTVFPGSVPEFARQAYPIVEQALLRAAAQLRPGALMGDVDRAARDTIIDAGYPEFHYGVGHGLGLAIHEAPWLRADADECCQADMLTTIEPGIYLPSVGGIRIENVYRVCQGGNECLGELPTALESRIIG